ncbi:hypothetical protein FAES_3953 [Fibrella aestuarina BUZ 2]|uniref:Uncharacterized protein n=1 Tax=Fibrella aestuarina BUZ 2 TaxID=1166018 RepID=I0KCV3_9BACT|nr:hypothetical protein [Fibrella aestuarina]CCH01956.1 hypothetical protein FAES_3953 [Fibrella aestuarina BUZ 2]
MLHTLVLIAALLLLQIYRLAARLALNTWYAQQQRRAEDWRSVEPPLLASLRRSSQAKAILRQYPSNQGFARGGVINKPHGPLLR